MGVTIMKVILKGPRTCQLDIMRDGHFRPGGTIINLEGNELAKAKSDKLIENYVDKDGKFVEKLEITNTTKTYTEKEVFAWNKAKQIKFIDKLGIKPASKEAGRVKQILEAQK